MPEKKPTDPFISVVVAVRNDNYGGDFNFRLQNFINWNTRLFEKYEIDTEIILVNWNPVVEGIPLTECIVWPTGRKHVAYRIIEVDRANHEKFSDVEVRRQVPLYEFLAKNVGIFRASGQFVLCTNADILFSEASIKHCAVSKLNPRTLYRAIRVDFNSRQFSIDTFERTIADRLTTIFLRTGSFRMVQIGSMKLKVRLANIHDRLRRVGLRVWLMPNSDLQERLFIFKYPFNACGDFALMDRETWLSGCHYREDTRIATHTDSIHLLTCLNQGIRVEEVEDAYVFHQEHDRRFDFSSKDKDMDVMFARLLRLIKQHLDGKMLDDGNTGWGLNEVELNELWI